MAKQDIFFSHQVLGTLFSVTNKIQAHGGKYLKNLSVRQMELIGAIIHLPEGKATINNIARFIGTTKQSVKQIVAALEKKQYLKAVPSERDKRAVNVTITPLGKRIIRACSEHNNEFIADIFQEFTRADLQNLLELLEKLYRFDGIKQESFEEKMKRFDQHNPQEHSHKANKENR